MSSRSVPYTGGDPKKSSELGKMLDIPGIDPKSSLTLKLHRPPKKSIDVLLHSFGSLSPSPFAPFVRRCSLPSLSSLRSIHATKGLTVAADPPTIEEIRVNGNRERS